MRISDWSSDVCSSDLGLRPADRNDLTDGGFHPRPEMQRPSPQVRMRAGGSIADIDEIENDLHSAPAMHAGLACRRRQFIRNSLPGFMMLSGSSACLTARITGTASGSSAARNSILP